MIGEWIAELVIAVFAVFGVYAALRGFLALCCPKRGIFVAIELQSEADFCALDLRLLAARCAVCGGVGRAPLILLAPALFEDERIRQKLAAMELRVECLKK